MKIELAWSRLLGFDQIDEDSPSAGDGKFQSAQRAPMISMKPTLRKSLYTSRIGGKIGTKVSVKPPRE